MRQKAKKELSLRKDRLGAHLGEYKHSFYKIQTIHSLNHIQNKSSKIKKMFLRQKARFFALTIFCRNDALRAINAEFLAFS